MHHKIKYLLLQWNNLIDKLKPMVKLNIGESSKLGQAWWCQKGISCTNILYNCFNSKVFHFGQKIYALYTAWLLHLLTLFKETIFFKKVRKENNGLKSFVQHNKTSPPEFLYLSTEFFIGIYTIISLTINIPRE